MATSNITMIARIARALGDLKEKMVFVGGSVAELYADFPEISEIRPTLDVDCVVDIQICSYLDYIALPYHSEEENIDMILQIINEISGMSSNQIPFVNENDTFVKILKKSEISIAILQIDT